MLRRKAKKLRKRLIGTREIILVLIAFSLLALAPSIAQITGKGSITPAVTVRPSLGLAERPETNFAGSAFYFLDQNYSIPTSREASDLQSGNGSALSDDMTGIGPAARAFVMSAAGSDYSRALKCLTDAIYYEAATEADVGQRAVAQVILNRMRHPTYPNTVCGVVYQGSERQTGCQFSYSCDGSMARVPSLFYWNRARQVAMAALAGYVYAPVGMATHYHTTQVNPYWASSLHFISTIGAHRFYRWKGSAGRPSAFFRSYAGNEPFPGPKPRAWNATLAPMLDPIQLQQQYEREFAAARLKAEAEAKTAQSALLGNTPTPAYAAIDTYRQRATKSFITPVYSRESQAIGGDKAYVGGNLPSATDIKSEYQNSGTWKKQPTG